MKNNSKRNIELFLLSLAITVFTFTEMAEALSTPHLSASREVARTLPKKKIIDSTTEKADLNSIPSSQKVTVRPKDIRPQKIRSKKTQPVRSRKTKRPSSFRPRPKKKGRLRTHSRQLKTPLSAPTPSINSELRQDLSASQLKRLKSFENTSVKLANQSDAPLIFDLPVLYNDEVKKWISFFQTRGKRWFKTWIERSHRYIPLIQEHLSASGLPKDLAYVAMIESGFSSAAVSSASAVGPWQFMKATGQQYGLRSNWWLDERRDWTKSTKSAVQYFSYLYPMFNNWYLAASAYNMGENRLKRLMKKYKTKNFWKLSNNKGFAKETKDYVPKLIAAILIAKAPGLYGFRNIHPQKPLVYDMKQVPGGTDLVNLADYLGVTRKFMLSLNPELLQGFIPKNVVGHKIRIPKGSGHDVNRFLQDSKGINFAKRKTSWKAR